MLMIPPSRSLRMMQKFHYTPQSSRCQNLKYWCFRNRIKLNESKTAILAINFTPDEKQRIENYKLDGVKVFKEEIVITGVTIGNSQSSCKTTAMKGWTLNGID